MKLEKESERVVLPDDPVAFEQRLREVETACRGILMKLTPEERVFFHEYACLLRRQEDRNIQSAFYSGIRVGQQRKEKEKKSPAGIPDRRG